VPNWVVSANTTNTFKATQTHLVTHLVWPHLAIQVQLSFRTEFRNSVLNDSCTSRLLSLHRLMSFVLPSQTGQLADATANFACLVIPPYGNMGTTLFVSLFVLLMLKPDFCYSRLPVGQNQSFTSCRKVSSSNDMVGVGN